MDGAPVVPDQMETLAGQQRIGYGGKVVDKFGDAVTDGVCRRV